MGKSFPIVSKRVFAESQHQFDEQLGIVKARDFKRFLGDAHWYDSSTELSSFYVEDRRARPNKFQLESSSNSLRDRILEDLNFQMKWGVSEFPKPSRQFFIIRMIKVFAYSILKIVGLSDVEGRMARVEEIQTWAPGDRVQRETADFELKHAGRPGDAC